ncbi:MAG TPA: UTP--glucose-1-phosphate uridylyltransferase GalU [Acidobacteriaceae bacterium]
MTKKIHKAVFPAAGFGTRFLPATKAIPKEMLSLVDKPLIQYGVEEALAAGIDEIIIITSRGKSAIEDHFDMSPELETSLEARGKTELLELTRRVSNMVLVSSVRQKEPLGLGHAVLQARDLVGDEPFAVILPDDVIDADTPCLKQMVDVFHQVESSILATQIVEGPAISSYGVLDSDPVKDNPRLHAVKGLVEKPKPADAPSKNAIIGRYILTPRVFEILEHVPKGAGGEIQLTDGIKGLLDSEKVFGYTFEGTRYDAGDKLGMLQATVDLALKRPDLGPGLREHLKRIKL